MCIYSIPELPNFENNSDEIEDDDVTIITDEEMEDLNMQEEEMEKEWPQWNEDPYSFEKEILIKILYEDNENLKNDAPYWPENEFWSLIKEYTNVDVDSVMAEYSSISMTCPYTCSSCIRRNIQKVLHLNNQNEKQ